MKDLDRYNNELLNASKHFRLEQVLKSYQLPNFEDLHNMICKEYITEFEDVKLYESAESIDYFKYEKELWNLKKQ